MHLILLVFIFMIPTAHAQIIKTRDGLSLTNGEQTLFCQGEVGNKERWINLSFHQDFNSLERTKQPLPSYVKISSKGNPWTTNEKGNNEELRKIKALATNQFIQLCGEQAFQARDYKGKMYSLNFLQGFDWKKRPTVHRTIEPEPILKKKPEIKPKKFKPAEKVVVKAPVKKVPQNTQKNLKKPVKIKK